MTLRLIVLLQLPLDSPGGGPVHCLELCRHLQRLGAHVTVVPVQRAPVKRDFRDLRVEPVEPSRIHYLLDGWSVARRIDDLLKRDAVDAVVGWGHEMAFLPDRLSDRGVLVGMIAAFPAYEMWRNRSTSLRPLKSAVDRWFRARPLLRANVVFVASHFTRQELIAQFGLDPERIVLAPLGVRPEFLSIPRDEPSKITRLLFFGSLAPLKGVFDAIRALGWVALHDASPWTLRIAGSGDEDQVRRVAQTCGIAARVELLGELDRQEILPQLQWAQLAILPSHAESFGLAIAEAQAAGLAVISYNAAAIPEVVETGRTGWLVPRGDVASLADAVAHAIQDPTGTYRLGLAGRERARSLFDWERTAATVLNAISERQERPTQ